MNAASVLLGAAAAYALAFRFYGRRLEATFGVEPARPTPAHERRDGVDFVPTRWVVLFGHHFSSICGAGPIVGPALAVAYWGWGPAVLWVVLGAALLGAVSDFASLMVSVRHAGASVADVSGELLGRRSRLCFMAFIWCALILVLAVFADLTARTLTAMPEIALPSMGLIGAAVIAGRLSARGASLTAVTVVGLGLLAALMAAGQHLPIVLPQQAWVVVLLAYCAVASIVPVQLLLQPRDYLASYLLYAMIIMGAAGTLWTRPDMSAIAFKAFDPEAWPAAGPAWPMMFVTVACGALSGFHALVSGGTTGKQLDSEAHACRIGYGAMLLEGFVAVLVIVAVAAGLDAGRHAELLRGPGAVAAFAEGFAGLTSPFLGGFGAAFATLAINTFLLTTLDTATRIGRYLTEELVPISDRRWSTAVVIVAAAGLALPGHWRRIWAVFGASNQLIGALSLLVAGLWLLRRGRPALAVLVPAALMLVTTFAAFAWQLYGAAREGDLVLAGLLAVLCALALSVVFDALGALSGRGAALRRELS